MSRAVESSLCLGATKTAASSAERHSHCGLFVVLTYFLRHHLCCLSKRIVGEMSVSLRCGRVGVAKKASDDRQAEAAGDEVRGVRVPVVVNSVVSQTGGLCH